MNNDLVKKKNDLLFELALEEELEQDLSIKEYDDIMKRNIHIFSKEHHKRMKKIYKMANKIENIQLNNRKKYQLAVGMILFLFLSIVTVNHVEAVKLPILRFFTEIGERSTRLRVFNENQLKLFDEFYQFKPEYVPNGYIIIELNQNDNGFYIKLKNENSSYWYRYAYWSIRKNIDIDTENASISQIDINGYSAFVVQKDERIQISLAIGERRFYLDGQLPYEEAIRIMESIKF